MGHLKISEKYEPLFRWLHADDDDPLAKVDTVIVTGGRNSQKSFAVGTFSCVAAKDQNHRILYTRYTLTSTEDSIIPEFNEKIDLLNCESAFEVTRDRISGVHNQSKVVFKGIKTSSGNQTANLKSLKGFSMFVLEEAEEMPSFEDWDKIRKSIRATDVRNLNILLLNPTTKEHWIYQEFFESQAVPHGFNGIIGNVLYIHSTYLDMPREFIPDSIWEDFDQKRLAYEQIKSLTDDEVAKLQARDPKLVRDGKYYYHVVLGGWLEKAEGVIFTNWTTGDFVEIAPSVWGQDFGFSVDPTTLVRTSIDRSRKRLYVKQYIYKPRMTTDEIVRADMIAAGKSLIYGDSAEPRLIKELSDKGVNIKPTIKGEGSISAGIAIMQNFDEIIVDSESTDIIKELNNYVWHDKKSKTPVDAYNHAIDAIRYAVYPQYAIRKSYAI